MVKKLVPKETKVKRVETITKIKKIPTKSELEMQVKKLLQANDALEESNRKKIELLERFEGKIQNLENQIDYLSCRDIMSCKETQTEAGLSLKCDECNFEADNDRELGWHMGRHHGWPIDQKAESMNISLLSTDPRNCEKCGYEAESMYDLDAHTWDVHDESITCNFCENSFETDSELKRHKKEEHSDNHDFGGQVVCNFCDNSFQNTRDMMNHKKTEHTEKVNMCWHFSAGTCPFGETKCWFVHSSEKHDSNTTEYTCNFCEQVFTNKSEFLKHRKIKHAQNVPHCKNFEKGACRYENENCWFKHNQHETLKENEHENNKVVQRIFMMMEKMTERIIKMEMTNKNQNNES